MLSGNLNMLLVKGCRKLACMEEDIHLLAMVNTTVITTRQNLIRCIVNDVVTNDLYHVYVSYGEIFLNRRVLTLRVGAVTILTVQTVNLATGRAVFDCRILLQQFK